MDVPGTSEHALLGDSPPMIALRARLERASRAERTTLVCGETGTGKEVVARELHARSTRGARPLVTVHCGALPETLIEAELFGHERGAFTGATGRRDGLVRRAHGSTLFLDEINSLSLAAQSRLLRFLESGEVRAVGSDDVVQADTWVIAATNEDLERSVQERRFRADLFHRLDLVRLHLPPLRERGRDVELLAEHFLLRLGRGRYRFTDDARRALLAHPWGGNVRELRNRVESAVLLHDPPAIDARALGLAAPPRLAAAPPATGHETIERRLWALVAEEGLTLGEAIELCERILIDEALRHEANNRTRAAGRLGIHVRTIFKKLSA